MRPAPHAIAMLGKTLNDFESLFLNFYNLGSEEVADSGDGFDPLAVEEKSVSSGLGLAGLRERIESLGGKFEIRSTAYRGTVLSAKFSLVDLEIEDGE